MAIERRDDFITDAQGRALAGALVYYCTQPANTSSLPPSPLATVYSDVAGTATTNPQVTDGFGHAVAYLNASPLYTLVYVHPLFGSNPIILPDQAIGGGSGYSVFSGTPIGAIDGTNRVFTLSNAGVALPNATPTQVTVWCNFPLVNGIGFTVSGNVVTFATAPQVGDTIFAQGLLQ